MNVRRWLWLGIGCLALLTLVFGLIGLPAQEVSAQTEIAPVELTGTTFVRGELIETGYVFSDETLNVGPAKATLIHLKDDQYELRVMEEDDDPRLSIWELTISEDGQVGGTWFAEQLYPDLELKSTMAELWLYTGCMMVGDYPALSGSWDGEHLQIATSVHGRCNAGKYFSDPEIMAMFSGDDDPEGPMANGLDWDDGPVFMELGADLTVDEWQSTGE